jgi:hypothetical protein
VHSDSTDPFARVAANAGADVVVRAAYTRLCTHSDGATSPGGGRLTESVAGPPIGQFWPELAAVARSRRHPPGRTHVRLQQLEPSGVAWPTPVTREVPVLERPPAAPLARYGPA